MHKELASFARGYVVRLLGFSRPRPWRLYDENRRGCERKQICPDNESDMGIAETAITREFPRTEAPAGYRHSRMTFMKQPEPGVCFDRVRRSQGEALFLCSAETSKNDALANRRNRSRR